MSTTECNDEAFAEVEPSMKRSGFVIWMLTIGVGLLPAACIDGAGYYGPSVYAYDYSDWDGWGGWGGWHRGWHHGHWDGNHSVAHAYGGHGFAGHGGFGGGRGGGHGGGGHR
jgi:hypothetical protein